MKIKLIEVVVLGGEAVSAEDEKKSYATGGENGIITVSLIYRR